jgi:hypothetical protein
MRGKRQNFRGHAVMTKAEAVAYFRESILPVLVEHERKEGGGRDRVARWQEWSYYVDSLVKGHEITEWQAHNWTAPRCCE